jgi:hypothetical protein
MIRVGAHARIRGDHGTSIGSFVTLAACRLEIGS